MHNANDNNSPFSVLPVKRFFNTATFLLAVTVLSACGGGADSQSRPTPVDEEQPVYTGSLQSDDVRAFKRELWEKLSPSAVCGQCHRSDAAAGNRQSPYFADWLDVNLAYDIVVEDRLVDLANPADSILVQRVADGHQCWLGSTSLCESEMIRYIQGLSE